MLARDAWAPAPVAPSGIYRSANCPAGGRGARWPLTLIGRSAGLTSRLNNLVLGLAAAALVACSNERTAPTAARVVACEGLECRSSPTAIVPLTDALQVIRLPTYDGSGQAMHPDAALTPSGWGRHSRHLVLTPYPLGQPRWENPSLYAGDDGRAWAVEGGVTNPLVQPVRGYLSDPSLVYVSEQRELWLYYREASDSNYIRVVRSSDGVEWSRPQQVAVAPNHTLLSPSVVSRGPGDWQMWSVNGGEGCTAPSTWVERRTSADGLNWSPPGRVALEQPGYYAWHIDVIWIPSRGEYWALYNAKVGSECMTPAVFLATSPDGVTWTTYPSPVLERGAIPEFADVIYRSSLEYEPEADAVRFWFSGATYTKAGYTWNIATQRRNRAGLFTQMQQPRPGPVAASAAGRARVLPPPEAP